MRKIELYVSWMTLAVVTGIPLAAEQTPQNPPASAQTQMTPTQPNAVADKSTARAVPVQSTANSPEAANSELRPLVGELEKKLDSTSAKPGDAVVVKTTEQTATANGLVIPKGAAVMGRVVNVKPAGNGENSAVTIAFDHAQLRPGQNVDLRAVLQAIAPAADAGSKEITAGAREPKAASEIGALTGTSASPIGGSAVVPNTARPSVAPVSLSGNSNAKSGKNPAAVGTVVARQGNTDLKTTAIPGVLLATSADGQPAPNAAGAIVGAKQEVHLDSGTQIVLAVSGGNKKGTNTK